MLIGTRSSDSKLLFLPNEKSLGLNKEVAFKFISTSKEWHGGINYYRALFHALNAAPGSGIKPVVFVGNHAVVADMFFPPNVRVVRSSVFDRKSLLWFLDKICTKIFGVSWLSNYIICKQNIDVLSHAGPTGQSKLRNIAWIPDFQHLHLPQFFSAKEVHRRTESFKEIARRSDLILLSSESARRDFASFSPEYESKARVLRFCGLPPNVDWSKLVDLRATYGISGHYFYIPNQVWAHKNHLTAVYALAQIAAEWPDVSIICTGALNDYRNPEYLNQLKSEIERLGITKRFRLLGVIPYDHIAQLMIQSIAVINPSQFEGWSTTVEEAKALGVKMILSSIDVHHEQCPSGEAKFFESLDATSLAELLLMHREAPRPAISEENYKATSQLHSIRTKEVAREFARIVNELTIRARRSL